MIGHLSATGAGATERRRIRPRDSNHAVAVLERKAGKWPVAIITRLSVTLEMPMFNCAGFADRASGEEAYEPDHFGRQSFSDCC